LRASVAFCTAAASSSHDGAVGLGDDDVIIGFIDEVSDDDEDDNVIDDESGARASSDARRAWAAGACKEGTMNRSASSTSPAAHAPDGINDDGNGSAGTFVEEVLPLLLLLLSFDE
jgi:hypothetical protein